MLTLGQRVREYWTSVAVAPRPGATDAEVSAFEARFGVRLPADMREYLQTVNGMNRDDTDPENTSFWGLDRIQRAVDFYPSGVGSMPPDEARRYFIFCDMLMDAIWYAIRLDSDPAAPTPVWTWGGETPTPAAASLNEFFEGYLRDPFSVLF